MSLPLLMQPSSVYSVVISSASGCVRRPWDLSSLAAAETHCGDTNAHMGLQDARQG
jgi:hypothetical protein